MRGQCLHHCSYCYVPRLRNIGLKKYEGACELDQKRLKDDLSIPKTHVLFVCSCYDLFGDWVQKEWISQILAKCRQYPQTTFLFQTKNPLRFKEFLNEIPENSILGVTLETNRSPPYTAAPRPESRYFWFLELAWKRKMVSIEPVIDFDLEKLVSWIKRLQPEFVSIGADSDPDSNVLLEPTQWKVLDLIVSLMPVTEVRLKKNLDRLLPELDLGDMMEEAFSF
jgi:hypothetical protein